MANAPLSNGLIGLAVLIAAGFVSVDSLTDARSQPTPISAISERFVFDLPAPVGEAPDLDAARRAAAVALAQVMDSGHGAGKGDRLSVQTAPEIGLLTVERPTGPASSELVRFDPAILFHGS